MGNGGTGCSRCSQEAVYLQRATGRHLCSAHLAGEVVDRVRRTLAADGMPPAGSLVAVALSGGKDSTVLLSLLQGIARETGELDLVAITVDEGISGYREETLRAAAATAARYGVPHRTGSFAGLFGRTLDQEVTGQEHRACAVCGVLRRKALTILAREAGADCIATGHNLDDEAQSVLMNWLRGDRDRLLRDPLQGGQRGFLRRIKPLREIPEKEVALYGVITGLFTPMPECPYRHAALRGEARAMLNAMEQRFPGTLERLVQGQRRLARGAAGQIPAPVGSCMRCGEPATGPLCQACRLLEEGCFRPVRHR
ncbi:MAG: TIGR00269 family protein [Methanomicrobiales archaeon]|nr:TIGR00269 family protein [Methanomicrobiales archaeon]